MTQNENRHMENTHTRADLHVHSRHSDRPSEWFLRRIGAPESFVDPHVVYQVSRRCGMDFCTITDHNSIGGALEIAHLPGTFLSAEVTTYFPEDRCKVHLLVWGVSEAQFADIQEARGSIFDLRQYLLEQDIAHAVAHPFFQANGRLTLDHLEKLILMFRRFEGVNAGENARSVRMALAILRGLTPELIDEMADRQGLQPLGPRPWRKYLTGGSDDHSGAYLGAACTVAPHAESVEDYLQFLRQGRHWAEGSGGTTLEFAHSLYRIAYDYYRERLAGASRTRKVFARQVFGPVLEEDRPEGGAFRKRFRDLRDRLLLSLRKRELSTIERALIDELPGVFARASENGRTAAEPREGMQGRVFSTVAHVSQQFAYIVLQRAARHARKAKVLDCVQAMSSLAPLALAIAPYMAAFLALRRDRPLLLAAGRRFGLDRLVPDSGRPVILADAPTNDDAGFDPLNLSTELGLCGPGAALLSCGSGAASLPGCAKGFEAVGVLSNLSGGTSRVAFPPFLDAIEFIERSEFTDVIVSTAGPMGLVALAAARLLGLKVTVVGHNDFCWPVSDLVPDAGLWPLAQRYVTWFLDRADDVSMAEGHSLWPSEVPSDAETASGPDLAAMAGLVGAALSETRSSDSAPL
jgi:hypothetical protein